MAERLPHQLREALDEALRAGLRLGLMSTGSKMSLSAICLIGTRPLTKKRTVHSGRLLFHVGCAY